MPQGLYYRQEHRATKFAFFRGHLCLPSISYVPLVLSVQKLFSNLMIQYFESYHTSILYIHIHTHLSRRPSLCLVGTNFGFPAIHFTLYHIAVYFVKCKHEYNRGGQAAGLALSCAPEASTTSLYRNYNKRDNTLYFGWQACRLQYHEDLYPRLVTSCPLKFKVHAPWFLPMIAWAYV